NHFRDYQRLGNISAGHFSEFDRKHQNKNTVSKKSTLTSILQFLKNINLCLFPYIMRRISELCEYPVKNSTRFRNWKSVIPKKCFDAALGGHILGCG
ncbi:MAG: hypothetical protein KDG51_09435, partial [Calditrichaeota bacterium]|nr:hypothetical protein [Calditrichota bacterium]